MFQMVWPTARLLNNNGAKQSASVMEGRKRPGGTERAKLKKRQEVAAKCAKLTDMFSRQAATAQQTTSSATDDPKEGTTTEGPASEDQVQSEGECSRHGEARTTEETGESDAEREARGTLETAGVQQEISQAANSIDEEAFDYFSRPQRQDLQMFFSFHPQQPTTPPVAKVFYNKQGTNRKWLTFSDKTESLYCSVCLAFAPPAKTNNPFIKGGMKAWKHIHQRIEEHEQSKIHRNCADAYFLMAKDANVNSLLAGKQMSLHHEKVKQKRQVMERIVDVVKVIGKCGLSYRGDKAEAAYTLENTAVNHGNFLELLLLLGRYDPCLQQHISSCIEQSKIHHDSGGKGRGSLVTLFSKDIVNKVVDVLKMLIKRRIADEVREAGMFSVQIDTTQDVSSTDQCSVILRYVTDVIHERLVAVVDCEKSTGQHFTDLLKQTLDDLSIDIGTCVGNSTDGAANMQGQYQGFSALLSELAPTQIHMWCYAHVLNLVLTDTTGSVVESTSLFSILNDVAVFLKESWKRMQKWEEMSEDRRHRKLAPIGATRWWAKDQALTKVFGSFGDPRDALYVDLLLTLVAIEADDTMKSVVRAKAKGHVETLLRYEVILTAQIFLRIFRHTSPLSKYLQTHGMNILSAQRLVEGTEESLKTFARDFEGVKGAADVFVSWANKKLEEADSELVVESSLPEKRLRKKKRMPGELQEDDPPVSPYTAFEVKVHNVILDTVAGSINRRFAANATLASDFACLDPNNFAELRENGIPSTALQELSKCVLRFDDRATVSRLHDELYSLASQWERLKKSPLEDYVVRTGREVTQTDEEGSGISYMEPEFELESRTCSSCKNCAICVYLILTQYNLLTDAYHVIGLAYKFLLTLSTTQVACERSFSALKCVKTRLRSSMSQELLDAFMLMCVEKDILMSIDNDTVINEFAKTSTLLRKLLLF